LEKAEEGANDPACDDKDNWCNKQRRYGAAHMTLIWNQPFFSHSYPRNSGGSLDLRYPERKPLLP